MKPVLRLIVAMLIASAATYTVHAGAATAAGWPHVRFALYFTATDVDSLLGDSVRFAKTIAYFGPVRATHVYLEGAARGDVNVALLRNAAERFRRIGIRVSGAMVPIGRGGPSVYNNPDDMAALEKRMRALAGVFDDIILDDWLFTTATDPKSVGERGGRSWADYRSSLILEQSRRYIIAPAKEVNPAVRITIKYPNWYEGHRENGYDVYHEDLLFDRMAVGIETRDRMIHDQHIPVYSGYVFQKWWTAPDPARWVGSWLDNYGMKGNPNDYCAQVWQAVLAQAPEIILWCAGQLSPPNPSSDVYEKFVALLPTFDRVAGLLKGAPRGIANYLPYGSTGEYNIFGYLGMAGIPQTPVAEFPAGGKNAIFTLHSSSDASRGRDTLLAEKMLGRLREGKNVFMSWGLWRRLRSSEFGKTLSLLNTSGTVTSDKFRVRLGWFKEDLVTAGRQFTFPRIETTTWDYVRDVAVERDDLDSGVLLHVPYLGGNIYILNMPDNSYDLLRLPPDVLSLIRRPFDEDLGLELEGPGGVGLYMFGGGEGEGPGQYVLYNMSDETAAMKLRLIRNVPASGWHEMVSGQNVQTSRDTQYVRFGGPVITDVPVTLKPFEIALLEAR